MFALTAKTRPSYIKPSVCSAWNRPKEGKGEQILRKGRVAGTGDFNNDTHVDILWRYNGAGGTNVIWYMDGVTWSESAELLPVADLNWRIVSR